MSLLDDFERVSRRHPCPVCHHADWCLFDRRESRDPARVICARVESPRRWKDAGWLHVLAEGPGREGGARNRGSKRCCVVTVRLEVPDRGPVGGPAGTDFTAFAERCRVAAKPAHVTALAPSLGLGAASLKRLGIGWASQAALGEVGTACRGGGCWSFPMRHAAGRIVGIRLRTAGGFKYGVAGSRQGLFIPAELEACDRLLIAEGPTDAAALVDLGFAAVGRPSCNTGTGDLVELVRQARTGRVVIVGDNDRVGVRAANALARALAFHSPDVRLILPPDGLKDARAWTGAAGVDAARQIEAAVAAAPPWRLRVGWNRKGAC